MRIEYEESLDVGKQIHKILDILEGKTNLLLELKKEFELFYKFSIVINMENEITPGLYLDLRIINFLSCIGAEFDCDMYIY
ncbi:MAG: DUF4279 domain-containing protein [Clostridiales bacterium]|nr:DUF4279 domain-containing protein [Clostridiales bacterium]